MRKIVFYIKINSPQLDEVPFGDIMFNIDPTKYGVVNFVFNQCSASGSCQKTDAPFNRYITSESPTYTSSGWWPFNKTTRNDNQRIKIMDESGNQIKVQDDRYFVLAYHLGDDWGGIERTNYKLDFNSNLSSTLHVFKNSITCQAGGKDINASNDTKELTVLSGRNGLTEHPVCEKAQLDVQFVDKQHNALVHYLIPVKFQPM